MLRGDVFGSLSENIGKRIVFVYVCVFLMEARFLQNLMFSRPNVCLGFEDCEL